jgi:hypothetical protein
MLVMQAQIAFRAFRPHGRVDIGNRAVRQVFPTGVHAAYVQLNTRWGAKVFATPRLRDGNHRRQKELSQKGIAPKVGKKFTAKTPAGNPLYGFITEHVARVYARGGFTQEEKNRIHDVMHAGYRAGIDDLHNNNIGMTSDGRALVIDVSLSDEQLWSESEAEFYLLDNLE